MRDRSGFSVSPTARESMLKLRLASIPEMWARTPGWFWTRADRTWRMGFLGRATGVMIRRGKVTGERRRVRDPMMSGG
jgi:hypothetical protein